MKTHLGAKTGLKKKKNPRKRVQKAPKHERTFGIQEHHSALLECRIASSWALAQFPSGDDKTHPFQSFHKRMSPNLRCTCQSYFLESSGLYK